MQSISLSISSKVSRNIKSNSIDLHPRRCSQNALQTENDNFSIILCAANWRGVMAQGEEKIFKFSCLILKSIFSRLFSITFVFACRDEAKARFFGVGQKKLFSLFSSQSISGSYKNRKRSIIANRLREKIYKTARNQFGVPRNDTCSRHARVFRLSHPSSFNLCLFSFLNSTPLKALANVFVIFLLIDRITVKDFNKKVCVSQSQLLWSIHKLWFITSKAQNACENDQFLNSNFCFVEQLAATKDDSFNVFKFSH